MNNVNKVFIIIPVYDNPGLTKVFINSFEFDKEFKIIIVDDHPQKKHRTLAKFNFVNVIYGNGSLFWGGSVNLGIKYIESVYNPKDKDILIIANNDIRLDFKLDNFIKYISNQDDATYHVMVKNSRGKVVKSCGKIISWVPFIQSYPKRLDEPQLEVDTLTGRFLAVPYRIIKVVGGICPSLPHYGGDSDLGLRIKRNGFKNYILRDFSCFVDMAQTGIIAKATFFTIRKVLFDIKSSYCIKYRWRFVRNHKNKFVSILVMLTMYIKLIGLLSINSMKFKK